MKYLLLTSLFALTVIFVQAQTKPVAEKSDPEAQKLLDKVRKKYEGYKTLEFAFTLNSEVPGQPVTTEKGTVGQLDNKFRLEMDQQVIINDGKATWVYLKKNNELQINDTEEDTENGFLTPKDLLRRYQKGDFLYAITDKINENGRLLTQVEFKPKDRNSEYAKIRVSIDEKNQRIESIKAFVKDGSRFTFTITRFSPDKSLSAGYFSFDKSKYPGVKVEDLRL